MKTATTLPTTLLCKLADLDGDRAYYWVSLSKATRKAASQVCSG